MCRDISCVSLPGMAHIPPRLPTGPALTHTSRFSRSHARSTRAPHAPDAVRKGGLLAKFPGMSDHLACPVPCVRLCPGQGVRSLAAWGWHRSGGEPKLCTQVSTSASPASPPPSVGSLPLRHSVGALGNLVDRTADGACHRRGAFGHPDLRTRQRGVMQSSA